MKYLFIIVLLFVLPDDFNKISKINRLKREAAKAYKEKAWEDAIIHYRILVDSLNIDDDRILLNLSNAYYQIKDTSNAIPFYQQLLNSKKSDIRSIAQQQMGVIANDQQKYDEALAYFKEAIKSNHSNKDARYNYELLKKLMQEQQQNQQNKQNQEQNKENKDQKDKKDQQDKEEQNKDKDQQKDQENQQQQDQSQQDQNQQEQQKQDQQQEQEQSEKEKQPSGKKEEMEEMKISEEKARMILEAMRNNEIQYIQQNQRKAKKKKDNNKPDW